MNSTHNSHLQSNEKLYWMQITFHQEPERSKKKMDVKKGVEVTLMTEHLIIELRFQNSYIRS